MTRATSILLPLALLLLLFVSAASMPESQIKVTNNPADQLATILNDNRTASNASLLYDNPGLACIALQYIKAYQGNCDAVGGPKAEKPADSDFVSTFAPDCGIQVSSLAPITGRLLGCETKYVSPSEAFNGILMKNEKSIEIVTSKNHTEVGAAISGSDGGSPYFWCILFSNGTRNSSFVYEGSEPTVTRPGCFSGANDDCSGSYSLLGSPTFGYVMLLLLAIWYTCGIPLARF
ncbi:hypothetical protein MLD38_006499 [Melastoma candidum]|uniref:Uncharacterized protein n=1 Tax=Melastoma candidum TaxID=119954 RepID=A0ACB9RMR1_9MYRT|nr:hypothetical protein MLD38_006499 [Melastoma candidum]